MRTSYDVFAEGTPSYTDSMTVSFDMAIYPDVDPIAGVGYVMRFIADGANRRIFNVYVDCRGDNVYNRQNEKCNFEKRKVHFLVFSGHFGRVCLTAVQSSLKRCLIG